MTDPTTGTEWYWDLRRHVAVPANERGPSGDMLGPYPTRADAENWKSKHEERDEGWASDDAAWENVDDHAAD